MNKMLGERVSLDTGLINKPEPSLIPQEFVSFLEERDPNVVCHPGKTNNSLPLLCSRTRSECEFPFFKSTFTRDVCEILRAKN
jgi:hypothetical protein